ncbi:MAG: FtsQ-type POTRA domain-containing protein [Geodermatophilaceae bacterium]|nr:FtsQ-type POTRA domain-containing protein [Geodermatophilaceae bacterium]
MTWRPSGRMLAWTGGVLAVLVALVVVVVATPVMSVRTVEVSGARGESAAVVRDLADVPLGVPLARLDTAAITERLSALPQLASVRVDRGWPSTVTLVVTERVPLALVDDGGRQWLVDAEGVLFAQVTEAPAGLPVLEVDSAGPDDVATRAALGVLRVLPEDIRQRVGRITATSADGVQLKLVGGRTVVWGSAEDSVRKAEVLAAVFSQPGGLIDVSSPEAVVIR